MRYSKIDLTGRGDYLTAGECLFLNRRREGLNQDEKAEIFRMSRHMYAAIERDEISSNSASCWAIPRSALSLRGGVKDHERCVILRRRAGPSHRQRDVATVLGVSRLWINKMETGQEDCTRLLSHWLERR